MLKHQWPNYVPSHCETDLYKRVSLWNWATSHEYYWHYPHKFINSILQINDNQFIKFDRNCLSNVLCIYDKYLYALILTQLWPKINLFIKKKKVKICNEKY